MPCRRWTIRSNMFNLGDHHHRACGPSIERLFWAVCSKILKMISELDYAPEELQGLKSMLSDTYFCNFSVFQSMPDSWAIKQLFPIMPIHRLNEAADAPGGAGRHHLRLGRQDRPVHRPARRAHHAGAAPVQRPALLSRRVPARRLSGNPRRPAQPLRRHQRRPRAASTRAARSCSTASSRETRCAKCWRTCSTTRDELLNRLRKDVERAVAGQQNHRARIAATAAVLRDRGWKGILISRSLECWRVETHHDVA